MSSFDIKKIVAERLGEMKSKWDFSVRSKTGHDLVPFKKSAIDEAFAKLGLTLGYGPGIPMGGNAQGHSAGRVAGQGAAINQGIRDYSARRGAIR